MISAYTFPDYWSDPINSFAAIASSIFLTGSFVLSFLILYQEERDKK